MSLSASLVLPALLCGFFSLPFLFPFLYLDVSVGAPGLLFLCVSTFFSRFHEYVSV